MPGVKGKSHCGNKGFYILLLAVFFCIDTGFFPFLLTPSFKQLKPEDFIAGMTEYSLRNEWLLAITGEFTVRFQGSHYHWSSFPSLRYYHSMLSPPQVTKCNAVIGFLWRELLAVWLLSLVMTKVILFCFLPHPCSSGILANTPLWY